MTVSVGSGGRLKTGLSREEVLLLEIWADKDAYRIWSRLRQVGGCCI